MSGADEAAPERPKMTFRRSNLPRMEAGSARRQGDVSSLAFEVLGRDEALAFLNAEHAVLGGRPIDLAVLSDQGRASVVAELGRLGAERGKAPL